MTLDQDYALINLTQSNFITEIDTLKEKWQTLSNLALLIFEVAGDERVCRPVDYAGRSK